MNLNRFKILAFALFFLVVCNNPIFSQFDSAELSVHDTLALTYDFFSEEAPFNCTMEFDIKSYQKNKYEGEYMPVKMTYHDIDSVPVERDFRVKARGTFRRQHCGLPPLWLNIRNEGIEADRFQDMNKIKMVTHCRGGKSYNQYVLKEFLVYRIFNLISPYSFRTRLTEVKYIDTGRNNKTFTNWAFLIEPEEMLASRLNCISLELDNLGMYHVDSLSMDVVAMFMYMIGNSDFSVSGRHNLKLIKENDPLKYYPIPVPYDFDYCGLVNAYYAVPNEDIEIESVTERYFLGPCRTDMEYIKALSVIRDKEDEIFSLINEFPYLGKKDKDEMITYLKSFFEQASYFSFISKKLLSTCRIKTSR